MDSHCSILFCFSRSVKSDGGKLDWVLEKMEELQQMTPAKRDEIAIAEIPDLPEEEEDDDLEYDPALDPDKSRFSDDEESSVANSDIGTPGGPRSVLSQSSFGSPLSNSGKDGPLLSAGGLSCIFISSTFIISSSSLVFFFIFQVLLLFPQPRYQPPCLPI